MNESSAMPQMAHKTMPGGCHRLTDKAKAEGRTLEGLGITPETIEAVVPTYLWRFLKGGQFASGRYA